VRPAVVSRQERSSYIYIQAVLVLPIEWGGIGEERRAKTRTREHRMTRRAPNACGRGGHALAVRPAFSMAPTSLVKPAAVATSMMSPARVTVDARSAALGAAVRRALTRTLFTRTEAREEAFMTDIVRELKVGTEGGGGCVKEWIGCEKRITPLDAPPHLVLRRSVRAHAGAPHRILACSSRLLGTTTLRSRRRPIPRPCETTRSSGLLATTCLSAARGLVG